MNVLKDMLREEEFDIENKSFKKVTRIVNKRDVDKLALRDDAGKICYIDSAQTDRSDVDKLDIGESIHALILRDKGNYDFVITNIDGIKVQQFINDIKDIPVSHIGMLIETNISDSCIKNVALAAALLAPSTGTPITLANLKTLSDYYTVSEAVPRILIGLQYLYDTYASDVSVTKEVCLHENMSVEQDTYEESVTEQKELKGNNEMENTREINIIKRDIMLLLSKEVMDTTDFEVMASLQTELVKASSTKDIDNLREKLDPLKKYVCEHDGYLSLIPILVEEDTVSIKVEEVLFKVDNAGARKVKEVYELVKV